MSSSVYKVELRTQICGWGNHLSGTPVARVSLAENCERQSISRNKNSYQGDKGNVNAGPQRIRRLENKPRSKRIIINSLCFSLIGIVIIEWFPLSEGWPGNIAPIFCTAYENFLLLARWDEMRARDRLGCLLFGVQAFASSCLLSKDRAVLDNQAGFALLADSSYFAGVRERQLVLLCFVDLFMVMSDGAFVWNAYLLFVAVSRLWVNGPKQDESALVPPLLRSCKSGDST